MTPHFLNMDIVARTFKQIWRLTNGFSIWNLSNNVILFVFNSFVDVDKIIQNQPWSFDKHLVVLQSYVNYTPIQDLDFSRATFWVQVHNIPIRYLTKKVAECICETVGEVHKSTGEVNEDVGNFIQVRVTLDINLPLCRGRVVTLESGDKRWVSFKYERLSNLCYWCGRLNHDDKSCE